jgi:hypothetical protein
VPVDRGVTQRRDLLARLDIAKPDDQPGKDASLQEDARADGIVGHGGRSVTSTRADRLAPMGLARGIAIGRARPAGAIGRGWRTGIPHG